MKKAVVIILSIILAFSGGLLIYGSTLGASTTTGSENLGDLLPPDAPDVYAHGIAEYLVSHADQLKSTSYGQTFYVETNPSKDPAIFASEVDGWYDVFGKSDPSIAIPARYSGADLVGNLIVPITYNHNRAKQFCMNSKTVISASGNTVYADNLRVRQQIAPFQVDTFYRARSWAGSSTKSSAPIHVRYADQKLDVQGGAALFLVEDYDEDTDEYTYKIPTPEKGDRGDRDLDRETPYKTQDMLCFPIDFGDKSGQNPVNSSVVDGSTVVLTEPTSEKPYYTLTFSENPNTAQTEENLYGRLNEVLGKQMAEITIKQADFTFEIWECGLFRQMTAHFVVNAKIGGKKGDAEIDMNYKFYYDDYACDVVRLIGSIGWEKYLSDANRAEFESRKKNYDEE